MRYEQYLMDAKGKPLHPETRKAIQAPTFLMSFADDDFSTKQAFFSMAQHFKHAKELHWWHYENAAKEHIGHVGFFRKQVQQQTGLWDKFAQFIVHGTVPQLASKL